MYKGYKDIYDVRGNGKDYSFGDVVQVAGQKGKVKWTNSAKKLLNRQRCGTTFLNKTTNLLV